MSVDTERLKRVSALFDELDEMSPADCVRRLAELRSSDPEVALELSHWLEKDQKSHGALHELTGRIQVSAEATVADPGDRSGQRIGAYELLRRVGRGGMGEVYEARRPGADFEQRVAIKLLRRGLDSDDIVRRFLRERRILAQLEHPGIARLIDGGLSEDGLPYLVMEFVDGSGLIDAANAHALDLGTRLQLFLKICDAVAYAHRRLIVHRDLKPSNVLLTHDNQPKLLDFGIAKLLDEVEDEHRTGTGMRVLTPSYAAPEQILGQPISTATDVYALGVILYELLTGLSPHQRRGKDLDRVSRDLDQESLIRPSAALLLNPVDAAPATQTQRQRRARQLHGDLDTIVLHALKREPERRYQGAAELADDIRRHLNGHPVRAEADTMTYRMRKFVKRHRGGVTAATLAILGIVSGLVVALWQADVARLQAKRADVETRRANLQASRAEHVKDFVLALFREQSPLMREKARAATAGELVERGIAEAKREFATDIEVQAEIIGELADLQFSLGDIKQSVPHLQSALKLHEQTRGKASTGYAVTLSALGGAWLALGERELATEAIHSSLATLRKTSGPDTIETALAETRLIRLLLEQSKSAEVLPLAEHAHAVFARVRGASHNNTLQRLYNVGVVLDQLDRLDEAENIFRQVIAGYESADRADHAQLVYPRTMLGSVLKSKRKYDEAATVFAGALNAAQAVLDPDHPMIGQISMHLGDLMRRQARYAEAERYWQTAKRIFGKLGSAELGMISIFQGAAALEQDQFDRAIAHYQDAIVQYQNTLGPDNVYSYSAALRLAKARAAAGQIALAMREGKVAHEAMLAIAEPSTFDETHAYEAWAEVLFEAKQWAQCEAAYRKALSVQSGISGKDHVSVASIEIWLAETLHAQNQESTEASALLDRAIALLQTDNVDDPSLGDALLLRGKLRARSGSRDAAIRDWQAARNILLAEFGATDDRVKELALLLDGGQQK